MILDVFPSYKDKDIVDLLYQFERATGLSLNVLVEKYLEKLLYDKGYLRGEVAPLEDNSPKQTEIQEGIIQEGVVETKYVDKNKFKVSKVQQNSYKLTYGKLSFGQHPSEMIEDVISKLSGRPLSEVECLSKEQLESKYLIPKGRYPKILREIVDSPSEDIENIIVNSLVSFKKKSQYEGYDLYLISTYAGYFSKEEMNEFKKNLSNLDISSVYELRDLIKNTSSKKKEVVMEFIEGYGKS